MLVIVSVLGCGAGTLHAQEKGPSPKFTSQFVPVDKDVKLEVVDWGGTGRPLVLLAALGADAHEFDGFAPKLAERYHVYGITRRGFGASSSPASGYTADQLGDDVLAVIDALKISRPILVGHSIAGEELSSVGSRHPEKVAGLVYLEAAYSYAYYNAAAGDLTLDTIDFQRKLQLLLPGKGGVDRKQLVDDLLQSMPQLQRDLAVMQDKMRAFPEPPKDAKQPPEPDAPVPIKGIFEGEQKYTDIRAPILAIYAVPHAFMGMFENDPAGRAKAEAEDLASVGAQADALQHAMPRARVVRIPHATHYIMGSNEADVMREMNAFIGQLP
jgi:pimeloyl-ACP methyl ester carboxylesterase